MIIGLTGTMGSGKSEISRYLKTKGFNYISISDLIREELLKRNSPLKRENLQNLGNELRKQYGNNYWAKKVIEKIDLNKDFIIDGIRNLGEIEELRSTPNFYLVGIDSPESLRLIRIKRRKRIIDGRINSDPKENSELRGVELRDRGFNEPEHGQQVLKCIEIANFTIINDSSLDELKNEINKILEKIHERRAP